jgi:hypothetical protein
VSALRGMGVGLIIVAGSSPVAWAQTCPRDLSRDDMVGRAHAARGRGDHREAIRLARCAGALEMRPLLRLFLATEHQALGEHADALREARGCVEEGQRPPMFARIEECRAMVRELEPRVEPPAPPATPRAAPPAIPPPSSNSAAHDAPLPATTPAPQRASGAGPWPWVVVGAGALSLGLAGLFGKLRADAASDMEATCDVSLRTCLPAALDARDRANDWGLAANVAVGVGAAAVVGGVVWWLVRRSPAASERGAGLTVNVVAHANGATVEVGGAM